VRNKAHLVAQGFNLIEGLDFGKTFAPIAHLKTIRIQTLSDGCEKCFPKGCYSGGTVC
jgi:hypothetical protein